jgi:glycosyltransferase involved in cell wall biosynthesis
MKNDLIKSFRIPSHKITIIHNPCDIDRISKMIPEVQNKKLKTKIIKLIAVARLEKQKGLDLLLMAFAKLDRSRFYLTILGQGSEEINLRKLILKYDLSDRVNLAGFKSNPYKYMAEADLFILSSRYEGFPNVVLESMACGTPVVAFKCPGGIDEIISDNINGFLVKNNDIHALANRINEAANVYMDTNEIIQSIKQKFSCEKIVSKYEKFLLRNDLGNL